MPTEAEAAEAREQFLLELLAMCRRQGFEAKLDATRAGVFLIDEPGGGWGYYLGVANLAITDPMHRRLTAELLKAPYLERFEPVYACRVMNTRHCPAVYEDICGDERPCARFESEDETLWLPELEGWPS